MIENILIADDHSIVRIGLSLMIKKLRPQAVIKEAESFKNVLNIITKIPFDLIILDVNMPNGTFQQTFDIIKIKQPKVKVLIFSSQDENVYAIRYLKLGADGFLDKMTDEKTVKKALEKMFDKGNYMSTEVQDALVSKSLNKKKHVPQNPLLILSDREMEIAELIIKGLTLKEIANDLSLHTSSVSTYKSRILKKLEVQSVPELIDIFRFYQNL